MPPAYDPEQIAAILQLRASTPELLLDLADYQAQEPATVDTLNKRLKLYEALFTDLQEQIRRQTVNLDGIGRIGGIRRNVLANDVQLSLSKADTFDHFLGTVKDLLTNYVQMEAVSLGQVLYLDSVQDDSGMDPALSSGYTLDSDGFFRQTNSLVPAVLVTNPITGLSSNASYVILHSLAVIGGNKATFELSRDDGATYTALSEGVEVDASGSPFTGQLRIRATLANGATLAFLSLGRRGAQVADNYAPEVDHFTGDDTTGPFELTLMPIAKSVEVFLEGVEQSYGIDYTLVGQTLTFTSVVPFGHKVDVYYTHIASPNSVPELDQFEGDDTVGPFPLSFTPLFGLARVYLEGVQQTHGVDYTISGNQLTFTSVAPLGHKIDVYYTH